MEKLTTAEAASVLRRLELRVDGGYHLPGLPSRLIAIGRPALTEDEQLYLAGGIVTHGYARKPDWLLERIDSERIGIILGKEPGIVGPSEIVALLWREERGDELPEPLTELHLWAVIKTTAQHGNCNPDMLWSACGRTPVTDADVLEPEGRLYELYSVLATNLRRAVVMEARKEEAERQKQEKRNARWNREHGRSERRQSGQQTWL